MDCSNQHYLSFDPCDAGVAQLAEATGLEPEQWEFESSHQYRGAGTLTNHLPWSGTR